MKVEVEKQVENTRKGDQRLRRKKRHKNKRSSLGLVPDIVRTKDVNEFTWNDFRFLKTMFLGSSFEICVNVEVTISNDRDGRTVKRETESLDKT